MWLFSLVLVFSLGACGSEKAEEGFEPEVADDHGDGDTDEDLETFVWYQDLDGDGYGSSVSASASGPPWDSYSTEGGDCDDTRANVNPDALDDWYDGIDSDCGGEDDFDVDGDGYYPTGVSYTDTVYVPDSGELVGGDCDDDRLEVNPGMTDAWYDGIDSDCGGEDDFDADADGFYSDDWTYIETEYVDGSGRLVGGDCDDGNALVNPDVLEVIQDTGVDFDCDGASVELGAQTFRIQQVDGYAFANPHNVHLRENNLGVHVGLAADQVTELSSGSQLYVAVWTAAMNPAEPLSTEIDVTYLLQTSSFPDYTSTGGLGFWVDDDVMASGVGLLQNSGTPKLRAIHMGGKVLGDEIRNLNVSRFFVDAAEWIGFTDVDLGRDTAGGLHIVGCENDPAGSVLHYITGTQSTLGLDPDSWDGTPSTLTGSLQQDDFAAEHCTIHGFDSNPVVYSSLDGTFHAHAIVDEGEGILSMVEVPLVESGGSAMVGDTFSSFGPLSADDTGSPDTDTDTDVDLLPVASILPADISIPGRATSGWAIIADKSNAQIKVMQPDFTLLDPIPSYAAPIHADGAFGPVGTDSADTLFISFVNSEGDAFITWSAPSGGFRTPIQLAIPDFEAIEAAIWVDALSQNLLYVALIGAEGEVAMGVTRIDE